MTDRRLRLARALFPVPPPSPDRGTRGNPLTMDDIAPVMKALRRQARLLRLLGTRP